MNREWLPILWILAGIFFLIAIFSTWNRKESRGARRQALQDRESICSRLTEDAARLEIPMDMPACMRMMTSVPAGRRHAYRACMQEPKPASCLLKSLCRDVREPACAWAAAAAWENPETRRDAQTELISLCEQKNSVQACTQLIRISMKHPEITDMAGPSYWHARLCRITGSACTIMQSALAKCLHNPVSDSCRTQLDAHPDPVALFLACRALSGPACRKWAYSLFPHTKNPEDPYWSDERLATLCTLGDAASCAQLGHRRHIPELMAVACRRGQPDACGHLAKEERDPVRASFFQWRILHPSTAGAVP